MFSIIVFQFLRLSALAPLTKTEQGLFWKLVKLLDRPREVSGKLLHGLSLRSSRQRNRLRIVGYYHPCFVREDLFSLGIFLKSVSLTLFQMRTGVGIPMTSQLKYTWAPVTFQMSLGAVTMEGPIREGTKPNGVFETVFNVSQHARK